MKTRFYSWCIAVIMLAHQTANAQQYATYGVTVAGQKNCSSGSDSAHLYFPTSLYVDDSGNIHIADAFNLRVQKWKPGVTHGVQETGLTNPIGLFIDSSGTVYVSCSPHYNVQKWSKGAKLGSIVAGTELGYAGSDSAHFNSPIGIYIDSRNNVYVADQGNNRIQKWDSGAKYGITVAGDKNCISGSDSMHLNSPTGVYVDKAGNIYVADAFNNRIQKWAPGGKYGITVAGQKDGTSGADSVHLSLPWSVYVDAKGNMFIADKNNNRVQKWMHGAKCGVTVAGRNDTFSNSRKDSAHLNSPWAVYLDKNEDIYVADAGNNRIQKWSIKYNTDINNIYAPGLHFNIYPNPNNGNFTIDMVTANSAGKAHIQILNQLGQILSEQVVDNVNGKLHVVISNNVLPAGVYLVKVQVSNESYVQRIVIEK